MLAILLFCVQPLGAQQITGPGWNAWLGCWEAQPTADETLAPPDHQRVCVLPTEEANAVQVVTVEDGLIVQRERIEADGTERPVERDGCTGVQSATWSSDGERVFQSSRFTCDGRLERRSSGVLGIGRNGEWISVHAVMVGEFTDGRVVRYKPLTDVQAVSLEAANALANRGMALDAARTAAASPIALEDVTEALGEVDVTAVEGWLIESGQSFQIDADRLVRLADSGVPDRVIDLLVALSYPERFAINRSTREADTRPDAARGVPPRRAGPVAVLDPWYYPGGYYYPGYRGGRSYGGWYGAPVIIVRDRADDDGARLVKGRGYTRRGNTTGSGGSTGAARATGRSGSASPSAGSSGSSGGGSDSSTGRTAKPRS